MSVWEDVVATGLIGTDRRPVPRRAASELGCGARSDRRSRTCGPDAGCPASCCPRELVVSSHPARRARRAAEPGAGSEPRGARDPGRPCCLRRRWICSTCGWTLLSAHGQRVAPPLLDALAMLAARSPELDRMALVRAVGDRGVWFVEQNPQWARLAKSLRSHPQDASPEGMS